MAKKNLQPEGPNKGQEYCPSPKQTDTCYLGSDDALCQHQMGSAIYPRPPGRLTPPPSGRKHVP